MKCEENIDLIVTVVRKGWGDVALEASLEAGAQGGTIMYGRGTGVHEKKKLLGIRIEPEKEILLTAVRTDLTDAVMDSIVKAVELEKPGTGIAMVLPLKKVVGRVHMTVDDG